jgi:hypothetical protein
MAPEKDQVVDADLVTGGAGNTLCRVGIAIALPANETRDEGLSDPSLLSKRRLGAVLVGLLEPNLEWMDGCHLGETMPAWHETVNAL